MATKIADYTLPLLELTNARKAADGENFDASKDVRTLLLAKESIIANLTDSCLYTAMVDPQGNVINEQSLADILKQVSLAKEKDFNTLWALLHAQGRNAADKAVFGEDVDIPAAIAQIEAKSPELHGIIDQAKAWYNQFISQ